VLPFQIEGCTKCIEPVNIDPYSARCRLASARCGVGDTFVARLGWMRRARRLSCAYITLVTFRSARLSRFLADLHDCANLGTQAGVREEIVTSVLLGVSAREYHVMEVLGVSKSGAQDVQESWF